MYIRYLLSEPGYTSCCRLSSIMGDLSHDSVNRFLDRENYTPHDLFFGVKGDLVLEKGILSIDDSVLDKPYSDPKKAKLISYFWSGKHKRTVKGLNLVTLYYTDVNGVCVPVNYRIVDKSENKTKNEYFREMLLEVIEWGIRPAFVTGDAWYASLENLKFLRKQQLNFLFGTDNNRLVSLEKGTYQQIQTLTDFPQEGKIVYLKDYGSVKVFRQIYKDVYRYYIMGHASLENLPLIGLDEFKRVHAAHWNIECFHRAVKQVCNIERFQVRNEKAIMNHVFCAITAFVRLEMLKTKQIIDNWYQIRRDLFVETIKKFISQEKSKFCRSFTTEPVNA
jgi:hypothetical protein